MNWLLNIRSFLFRKFDLSTTSRSTSEAIILMSSKKSNKDNDHIDVTLLLQISPPNRRNYLIEHSGKFSNEEFSQFLQPGQRIYLIQNHQKHKIELTWKKNETEK